MIQLWIAITLTIVLIAVFFIVKIFFNETARAQRALNSYLNRSFSIKEIGTFYERYIGHLHEMNGDEVIYHGAINGGSDLGRDLIVKCHEEVHVVQAKCWSKKKMIHEKHIFQLYGSMMHFKLSSKTERTIKAVFYSTAQYSAVAQEAAKILGVELRNEDLNRNYPMIKCNVSGNGKKYYHLPFDPYYDKVKIKPHLGEFFAKTVKEAVDKGFRRAGT